MIPDSFEQLATHSNPIAQIGELYLFGILKRALPKDCIIHFQPYTFHGRRADFLVQRRGYGATLIEVKDWNEDLYVHGPSVDAANGHKIVVKSTGSILRDPVDQVREYKDDLFHATDLAIKTLHDPSIYGIVATVVVYTNYLNIKKCHSKHTTVLGRSDISRVNEELVHRLKLDKRRTRYTDEIHTSIFEAVQARFYPKTPSFEISATERQKSALVLPANRRRKIMGPAGSGKTTIALAACRHWAQESKSVLILVFTIAMRNHYRYLLDHVKGDFDRSLVHVMTYSRWIRESIHHVVDSGLISDPDIYSRLISIANGKESSLENQSSIDDAVDLIFTLGVFKPSNTYDCLIVDEAQDFKRDWLTAAERIAKEQNGDYLVLADEAQNVFGRVKENDGKVSTNISGEWYGLHEIHRHRGVVSRFCIAYRDLIAPSSIRRGVHAELQYDDEKVEYLSNVTQPVQMAINRFHDHRSIDCEGSIAIVANTRRLLSRIVENLQEHSIEVNRMVETERERREQLIIVVSSLIKRAQDQLGHLSPSTSYEQLARDLETYRQIQSTIDVRYSTYEQLRIQRKRPEELVDDLLEGRILEGYRDRVEWLDKELKNSFHSSHGPNIVCTVHSLKGQQVDNVIYIHDNSHDLNQELIYTAITRARKSLVVIDTLNDKILSEAYDIVCGNM